MLNLDGSVTVAKTGSDEFNVEFHFGAIGITHKTRVSAKEHVEKISIRRIDADRHATDLNDEAEALDFSD